MLDQCRVQTGACCYTPNLTRGFMVARNGCLKGNEGKKLHASFPSRFYDLEAFGGNLEIVRASEQKYAHTDVFDSSMSTAMKRP